MNAGVIRPIIPMFATFPCLDYWQNYSKIPELIFYFEIEIDFSCVQLSLVYSASNAWMNYLKHRNQQKLSPNCSEIDVFILL